MAYVKNIWVDQDVERPKTYEVTNNQDGSITLTDSFGLVTELGTPVNEVNMNHIEDGIAGCAIRKHNLTETFNLGEWVLGGTGDDEGIYKSLIANNVGNAITDDTAWEKVEMGGGAFRNIGEIVASTIPLTDAGLHLLDGSLIQGSGIYSEFVDYIADLYDSGDYTAIFDTEANWQTAVTTYGVCGKFVYDSVNNTVRLPKYNSKIYTGGGTAPVVGNGMSLGLTNGTTNFAIRSYSQNAYLHPTGAYGQPIGSDIGTAPSVNNDKSIGITLDATKSGIIAQLSDITTSLDCYYYIVIATSTKTDIQVDIDEIATDLNGKADIDLTNVTDAAKVLMSGMAMPSDTYIDLTLGTSGTTYIAPADGYFYIVLNTSGNGQYMSSNIFENTGTILLYSEERNGFSGNILEMTIPVRKGFKNTLTYNVGGATVYFRFIYAQGSESEA